MITTALTFVLGASAAAWILARLKMILIIGAAFVVTNLLSGGIMYFKGYNSAAMKCNIGEITRQRDEARRDLEAAKKLQPQVQAELNRQREALAASDKETANYAERLKRAEERIRIAEEAAAKKRPANCPACPKPRPCVVD